MNSRYPISSGRILVYYLFAIAEMVDLDKLRQNWSGQASLIQLVSRRAAPHYIQFTKAPLLLPLGNRPLMLSDERQVIADVRAKIFDFGVLSLAWEIPLPDSWDQLRAESELYIDNDLILEQSFSTLTSIRHALESALHNPIAEPLTEDYTIFNIQHFSTPEPLSSVQILKDLGPDIAALILHETKPFSEEQTQETLRYRISYFEDDLVVVDWNASFIYDPEGSNEHIDILEFANCELLELRYYDGLLDRELDTIYDAIAANPTKGLPKLFKNHHNETTQKLVRLLLDVIEVTDKIENSLKIIGDLYSARVYRTASERLRLREWQSRIDGKLESAWRIYQTLNDAINHRFSTFLELVVVALIAIEVLHAFFPTGSP